MKFFGKVGNGPVNKWLNFGGDPVHRLDTGIIFRIRHFWEIRKVVSTDCAARRCSAGHAPAGIAIAVCKTVRPMPSGRCPLCPVCVSETLVYCSQTVGWIKMPLGTEVGPGLSHTVLDWDPASPRKGAQQPPHPPFGPLCSGTVGRLSNC